MCVSVQTRLNKQPDEYDRCVTCCSSDNCIIFQLTENQIEDILAGNVEVSYE
jgi:hypothetical protein